MKKLLRLLPLVLVFATTNAKAYEPGSVFLDPHVAVGYNVAQGTFYLLGADLGYAISDQLAAGIGGFYAAGQRPMHDREFGGGPFVSFLQPLLPFLTAQVREDVDYIDQRDPIENSDGSYTHKSDMGMASITTIGLHFSITRNLGISGGYRAVLSLANSDLGKDRSGAFFGFSIGI